MQTASLYVRKLVVGELQTNCYIVADPARKKALVIDPGAQAERILEALKEDSLSLISIILTHAHPDHTGALESVAQDAPVPLFVHSEDLSLLQDPFVGLSFGGKRPSRSLRELKTIEDKEKVSVGGFHFTILYTPGHSPGSISVYGEGHLFTGDTLFASGVGRCDLPGGDWQRLARSIRDKLLFLPPETLLHPGHGPDTTLDKERRCNPFVRQINAEE